MVEIGVRVLKLEEEMVIARALEFRQASLK
jgi:hypothetical protein